MRVLFIFKSENFLVPIGMCAISAIARREGHDVYLSEMHNEDPLERIHKLNPDIVAYSSSSGEAKHYVRLNKRVKESYPNIFTVMGGPHPTFYPEIVNESTIDAACIGEGEEAFSDVLKALSTGDSLDGIKNIATKNHTGYTVRELVQDLDLLPFPDYSLYYNNTEMGNYPLKSFMASRGCPYNCTYCFNTALRQIYHGCPGKMVRRYSVDYIIEDIKRVKSRWPLSCAKFQDDIFSFKVDTWLEEFAKKYKKEVDLPFFILNRCDLLTEDMVKLLKYAGCRTISMSIEAGNPEVRRQILKRKMTDDQIIDAHLLCEKYGIATFPNGIFGLPDTTHEDDVTTLDLSLKSKVTWGEYSIFYPYPKTELGDYVIGKGYYTPDYDHMHTSYQNRSMLSCFTERQKDIQMNFAMLASVVVVFPWLRNFVLNHAIYWPSNRLFVTAFWIAKNLAFRKYIYSTKTSFWRSIRILQKSLRQEIFRHSTSEKEMERR